MQQDINSKFKNFEKENVSKMPNGHEARFLLKLDSKSVIKKSPKKGLKKQFLYIAASIILLISSGAFLFLNKVEQSKNSVANANSSTKLKTLGDLSPELKQVEDYYLANISLELSKMPVNENNKELFDVYLEQLEDLNLEYKSLSKELTNQGVTEVLVSALIENLKLRLQTLQRLKKQLQEVNQNLESNTLI